MDNLYSLPETNWKKLDRDQSKSKLAKNLSYVGPNLPSPATPLHHNTPLDTPITSARKHFQSTPSSTTSSLDFSGDYVQPSTFHKIKDALQRAGGILPVDHKKLPKQAPSSLFDRRTIRVGRNGKKTTSSKQNRSGKRKQAKITSSVRLAKFRNQSTKPFQAKAIVARKTPNMLKYIANRDSGKHHLNTSKSLRTFPRLRKRRVPKKIISASPAPAIASTATIASTKRLMASASVPAILPASHANHSSQQEQQQLPKSSRSDEQRRDHDNDLSCRSRPEKDRTANNTGSTFLTAADIDDDPDHNERDNDDNDDELDSDRSYHSSDWSDSDDDGGSSTDRSELFANKLASNPSETSSRRESTQRKKQKEKEKQLMMVDYSPSQIVQDILAIPDVTSFGPLADFYSNLLEEATAVEKHNIQENVKYKTAFLAGRRKMGMSKEEKRAIAKGYARVKQEEEEEHDSNEAVATAAMMVGYSKTEGLENSNVSALIKVIEDTCQDVFSQMKFPNVPPREERAALTFDLYNELFSRLGSAKAVGDLLFKEMKTSVFCHEPAFFGIHTLKKAVPYFTIAENFHAFNREFARRSNELEKLIRVLQQGLGKTKDVKEALRNLSLEIDFAAKMLSNKEDELTLLSEQRDEMLNAHHRAQKSLEKALNVIYDPAVTTTDKARKSVTDASTSQVADLEAKLKQVKEDNLLLRKQYQDTKKRRNGLALEMAQMEDMRMKAVREGIPELYLLRVHDHEPSLLDDPEETLQEVMQKAIHKGRSKAIISLINPITDTKSVMIR